MQPTAEAYVLCTPHKGAQHATPKMAFFSSLLILLKVLGLAAGVRGLADPECVGITTAIRQSEFTEEAEEKGGWPENKDIKKGQQQHRLRLAQRVGEGLPGFPDFFEKFHLE